MDIEVYVVVMSLTYEGEFIQDVFGSQEQAEAYIQTQDDKNYLEVQKFTVRKF